MSTFLAIDWGTTNRRVYHVDDGKIVSQSADALGVLAMAGRDWHAEVARLRGERSDLPVLIAGMAGSNRGWREAPYIACPATLDALAEHALHLDPLTALIPGVVQDTPRDVMRGEEVQFLGAIASGAAPPDGLLCQPGTHCKWARMDGGAIAAFTTAVPGELFSAMRKSSILADNIDGAAVPGDAFIDGVAASEKRDLLSALFEIRARVATGDALADGASYASGLLIGTDVGARNVSGQTVYVLADGNLGRLYADAIAHFGGDARQIDATRVFVAGATALWQSMR